MVATKAFVIGMTLMPILMLGGMWIPGLLQGLERSEQRTIAVIDNTGRLFDPLSMAARQRNAMTATVSENEESNESPENQAIVGDAATGKPAENELTSGGRRDEQDEDARRARRSMGVDDINTYVLEAVSPEGFDDEQRLILSEKIRMRELHAFVEIPAGVLSGETPALTSPDVLKLPEIRYCAQDAALSDVKRWLDTALNQLIRVERLTTLGVTPMALLELERRAPVNSSGLYVRQQDGTISSEQKPDEMLSIFLPMGIMMLMFMIIMMSAQPMLESVLEEKSNRISEVLLGSANARQLMTGKLLGNVAGSLTVFTLYAGGSLIMASWQGYADKIPFHVLPWFVVFQTLAVLMFSSLFMAIGASVSQLREAQSLLLPVWMVILLPMMVWFNVVREPNSMLATSLSFFPPSTPLMMTLRLATGAIIPWWQILLSVVLMVAGTVFGVIAASRIYRVGILWQGKAPKLTEMIGWIIRDPEVQR